VFHLCQTPIRQRAVDRNDENLAVWMSVCPYRKSSRLTSLHHVMTLRYVRTVGRRCHRSLKHCRHLSGPQEYTAKVLISLWASAEHRRLYKRLMRNWVRASVSLYKHFTSSSCLPARNRNANGNRSSFRKHH